MRLIIFVLIAMLVLPIVHGLDQFEEYTLSEKINAMPDRIIDECRAEMDAGMVYIEDKVDARIEGIPFMVYVSSAVGTLIGVLLGIITFLVLTRRRYRRQIELMKELIMALREQRTEPVKPLIIAKPKEPVVSSEGMA